MDADCYVAEYMIRDRLAEVRARARVAALLRQSNERSRRSNGIGSRLIDLGRSLVKGARKVARETSRALPSRTRVAERS